MHVYTHTQIYMHVCMSVCMTENSAVRERTGEATIYKKHTF